MQNLFIFFLDKKPINAFHFASFTNDKDISEYFLGLLYPIWNGVLQGANVHNGNKNLQLDVKAHPFASFLNDEEISEYF